MTVAGASNYTALRLYQVNHLTLGPPVLVAAVSSEEAVRLAARHVNQGDLKPSALPVDVTGEFEALSAQAREHTANLLSGGISDVVDYDVDGGWLLLRIRRAG